MREQIKKLVKHGGATVSNLNPSRQRSIFRPDQDIFEKETEFKIGIKKDEVFMKILGFTDFAQCKNDLDAVRLFWDGVWPTLKKIITDNEILLEEQKRTLRTYGQLMDDFKILEKKHEKLEEDYACAIE